MEPMNRGEPPMTPLRLDKLIKKLNKFDKLVDNLDKFDKIFAFVERLEAQMHDSNKVDGKEKVGEEDDDQSEGNNSHSPPRRHKRRNPTKNLHGEFDGAQHIMTTSQVHETRNNDRPQTGILNEKFDILIDRYGS